MRSKHLVPEQLLKLLSPLCLRQMAVLREDISDPRGGGFGMAFTNRRKGWSVTSTQQQLLSRAQVGWRSRPRAREELCTVLSFHIDGCDVWMSAGLTWLILKTCSWEKNKIKFYFCSPKKLLISALAVSLKPENVFCVIRVDTAKQERRKMRQQWYILQQMKDSGCKCQERKDPVGDGERLCLHKQFSSSAGTTMHFFFWVWPMDWQSLEH